MRSTGRWTVRWDEGRSGIATATWGQGYMYLVLRTLEPATAQLNQSGGVIVPPGVTLDGVLAAVSRLLVHCESLRTVIVEEADGRLLQRLTTGPGWVDAWDTTDRDDEAAIETARLDVAGVSFDPAGLPFRSAIVIRDGIPVGLVWAASHVACDANSIPIVNRCLAAFLLGAAPPDPVDECQQPMERAAFEQSEAGQRLGRRALDFWERKVDLLPVAARRPEHDPDDPRFWRGTLTSAAIQPAADAIARRLSTGTSAVLLAAVAHVLSDLLGTDRVAMQLTAGNRGARERIRSVANMTQTGLVVLDVDRSSLATTVTQAWRAGMQAYRHSQFDFAEFEALFDRLGQARGESVDLAYFFNDLRTDTRPAEAAADPAEIADLRSATVFRWEEGIRQQNIKFLIMVRDGGALTILVDTAFCSRKRAEMATLAIEELLVTTANPG
ncbi:hypothetical protein JOD64_005543 [Micromonospora luteifusca]|uniref:Condensation domain-containing protein n=1 Tax=Micromonospora luteifusca TaxID=709860 RepID=A0ABS2M1I7_9ACTN|nr:condensation domain-containing protein [Micromonospora luteifusca]MBM7494321.1 hypothetical protein [Micromonospora luteifusca]